LPINQLPLALANGKGNKIKLALARISKKKTLESTIQQFNNPTIQSTSKSTQSPNQLNQPIN